MDRRLVFAALAVVICAAVLWLLRDPAAAPPSPASQAAQVSQSGVAADVERAAAAPATSAAREAVAPGAAGGDAGTDDAGEPQGSLLVIVTLADKSPAPGIQLRVGRAHRGVPTSPLALATTGGDGTALFDGLPAGTVLVSADRGSRKEIEIRAGERQELRLGIAAGVDVEGLVVDRDGAPVAQADIWLTSFDSPWMAGAIVARSDANGKFTLRAVPRRQSLGALAPGCRPSALIDLELLDAKANPVRVELIAGAPGAALHGRVVDPAGAAIAGAMVAVGDSHRLIDSRSNGTMLEKWGPRVVATGPDGRYSIDSLAPGRHPVEAWARGFPIWRGACDLTEGAPATLDVQLAAGVTLSGTVRTAGRAPLAGAIVRAFPVAIERTFLPGGQYDFDATFGYPFTVAGADGSYRLRGVAPGEIHAFAGEPIRGRGEQHPLWAEAVLPATAGTTVTWDPIVEPGPTIRGLVRYRDGEPMPNVFVTALRAGDPERRVLVTDAQGRFRFVRLQHAPYDLNVQVWSPPKGSEPVGARAVWPDQGDIDVVAAFDSPQKLATGTVRGTIADAGGRVRGALGILLANQRGWRVNPKLEGGTFTFDRVEPGRLRVVVTSNEDPVLIGPWFELQPAEDKQLGTLVTEPGGALRLRLERLPGTEGVQPQIHVRFGDSAHSRKLEPGTSSELLVDNLTPGAHQITGYASGAYLRGVACTVAAGTETIATIRIEAAARRELVVDYAADQTLARIRVTGADGRSYMDHRVERQLERPHRSWLQLPIGRYSLSVETRSGGSNEVEFAVESSAPDQPPVRITAR